MPTWVIFHTDESEAHIEADSVSVAGSVMAFLTHSKIAAPDGKIQGIPIAFVDLSNPGVRLVQMENKDVQDDAEVLRIV